MPLDPAISRRDPVGHEVGVTSFPRCPIGAIKNQGPEIVARLPRLKCGLAVDGRDIAADGMSLVAVDAALALLKVDRVAWQVPVHEPMALGVKIQPLLSD